MLYNSLSEVHFIKVSDGSGTHSWIDANNNQKVDLLLPEEFIESDHGAYRPKTASEFIREIPWSWNALFWLLLAVLFMVGRDLGYMWRIKVLTNHQLSWKSSFYVIMLWEFASALAPGVASGSTVAMFILHREKIPLGKSTAIVIVTTMMDNLFYIVSIPIIFLFVTPAALFPSETSLDKSVAFVFWTAYAVFFLICLLLFLSIFFYPRLIKRFLGFIFRLPFLKKWRPAAIKTGEEVEVTSREFKKESYGFWIKAFAATIFSWTSRYLVINCILAGFIGLRLYDHFFILGKQFVLWLFMRISPTPGGSGVAEYAFGELMGDFTGSLFLLTALAILWRLISYFPYLVIGTLVLPRWMSKK